MVQKKLLLLNLKMNTGTLSPKILFISYDGMTDNLGQSQVIPYMAGLSKLGFDICILSAEKTEVYQNKKTEIEDLLNLNNIKWLPIKYTKKPPIISTILDIIKIKKKAKEYHLKNNIDIVHCRSYISAFAGLYLKRKYGIKFIFDMRGFYADERVDGKIWNTDKFIYKSIYKYFKNKEKEYIANADYTISLTNSARKIISEWSFFKELNLPIEVIPCCADNEHFSRNNIDNSLVEHFKQKLNIKNDDFIISYLGSVGTWYMLDEMLLFYKQLLLVKPNSKFLFITKDEHEEIYKKASKFEIPTDKLILQGASRNEVPTLLSLSKISIFFIKPVFSKKASSPTKLAEILSMGIPVIANSNVGDIDEIFSQNKIGLIVNEFNNEEFNRIIGNINDALNIPKENLINTSNNLFSLQKGIESYNKVYNSLLD